MWTIKSSRRKSRRVFKFDHRRHKYHKLHGALAIIFTILFVFVQNKQKKNELNRMVYDNKHYTNAFISFLIMLIFQTVNDVFMEFINMNMKHGRYKLTTLFLKMICWSVWYTRHVSIVLALFEFNLSMKVILRINTVWTDM